MGIPYPKTFTKGSPSYGLPANDNKPGTIWMPAPANDNKKKGTSGVPNSARRALRGMRLGDARARLIAEGVSLIWDMLDPEAPFPAEPTVGQPGWPGGVDFTGWHLHHDFGRLPHFDVGGTAGNGYAWPNVTLGTSFNYPFALAGYTGTPGVWDPTYVREFQNVSSALDPNDYFSVWHYHGLESVSGHQYWRVSSSQTWARDVGNTSPVPEWMPASDPVYLPLPVPYPTPKPWSVVRMDSKVFRDVHGRDIRGPAPKPRPLSRLRPFPRPPGRRTHERKISVSISGIGRAIIHAATESMDAIDALYDALPAWLRAKLWGQHGGYMSPLDKAEALYKHTDKIDLGKAVGNLLKEAAMDRLHGQLGRLTAKANARRDSPGGLQLGPALEGVTIDVS